MRGMLSASVMRKAERSTELPPALTISTHSSSRELNVPLPSQSRAGPARISLMRRDAAHAGRASDVNGTTNSAAVKNQEASLMTLCSAGAGCAGAMSAAPRGMLRVREVVRRRGAITNSARGVPGETKDARSVFRQRRKVRQFAAAKSESERRRHEVGRVL